MQGGSEPSTDGGEGDSRQQQQQQPQHAQNSSGLMGISHRHDDALTHNPTPSETLADRKVGNQGGGLNISAGASVSAVTGTLGVAPSPLLRHSAAGGTGRGGSERAPSSLPSAVLFPQTLFGEAAEPARAAPQSAESPQGTPRRAYGGGGSEAQCEPISDTMDAPSSPDTAATSASRSQRKRLSSDGSNSSTLVEMLMRSSPSRLRPRVGTNEYADESTQHVVKEDGDSSDSESEGERIAATTSKYDYDSSWNMVGNRVNMIGDAEQNPTELQEGAAVSDSSQPPGVLGAAVAASAAIAATVHNPDDSNQVTEGSAAANPRTRPVTPPGNHIASSADDFAAGTNGSTSLSANPMPASQKAGRTQQRSSLAQVNQSQSSVPSSPILLVPRRRTRSTPNAGTCYVAASPPIGSSSRKRRDYAYQKYSTNDLNDADSVDINDGFDAVQNIDSSEPQEAPATMPSHVVGDNPFDDFDGTPVVSHGDESRSTSSSSSSSVTHRRRRGQHIAPGTTIFGSQSAQSVSSFSGSISTATASVQPGHARPARHVPSDHGSSQAQASADSSDERNRAERSLRASLDAGMAAMRRWARSHAGVAGSAAASATQAGGRGPARSSRAATMQLGDEDVFALVNAGADPRRSISALEEEDHDMRGIYGVGGLSVFAPIAEEDEAAGTAGRSRAFSEPEPRVNNFFSRLPFQNRGSPIQRANSRQSRASNSPSRPDGRRFGQPTTPAAATAAQFGSSVISQMSSTDITAGARTLSSAAMSSSLFHSNSLPPRAAARAIGSSMGGRSFDDADLLESGSSLPLSPTEEIGESSTRQVDVDNAQDGAAAMNEGDQDNMDEDGRRRQQAAVERQARRRWVRINQRFQVLITAVALIFSLILFAVLVCWIVLTSSYVVSIDKACDVPLKKYFWLATLQLVFDVFRTDIMRHALRWDPNSGQRIPPRVILYNVAYLIYAICVLRIGVTSVYFSPESTCSDTAPEFFQAAAAFVTLSLAAWSTIVVGYLFPFCFVAIILTRNGYSPSSDSNGEEAINAAVGIPGVFPNAYANAGAPPECIDRLQVIMLHEFPDDYPRECCICMSDFSEGDVIVVTNCEHVFHKRCCQEWLQQARTCPVCRTDIPTALGMSEHGSDAGDSADGETRPRPNRPPLNREEFHQEVVSLLRILRQHEERLRDRVSNQDREDEDDHMSAASDNMSLPRTFGGGAGAGDIEENRMESEEVQSMPSMRPRSE